MKKFFKEMIVISTVIATAVIIEVVIHTGQGFCDSCGEVYRHRTTKVKEICDVCYGYNEMKARLTGEDIILKFDNGNTHLFRAD